MPALRAVFRSEHHLVAVYTQPDRPGRRGRKLQQSAIKQEAIELGLPVRQPEKFSGAEQLQQITNDGADLLVVVAYGQILPLEVLQAPRLGAVNVHASLLPRWRGAAPIQRGLLAGDNETGITLMQMEAGLDTGPMLLQHSLQIGSGDTTGSLQNRLADLGAKCLLEGLNLLAAGRALATAQPEFGITYAHKISKSEANIDWCLPASEIDRSIRAFNPVPGAFSYLFGERIKIFADELTNIPSAADPGTIVGGDEFGLLVATADNDIRLQQLQPAGSRPMTVKDFLNARGLPPGARFKQSQDN